MDNGQVLIFNCVTRFEKIAYFLVDEQCEMEEKVNVWRSNIERKNFNAC